MAAAEIHQFADCITCHAWNPDLSMVAFCPNNNEVHIYKFIGEKWEKMHVLSRHDQIVSAIDWSMLSNKIVTASHDRDSYVWSLESSQWIPAAVILKLNRAALCVKWSPKENKFAVGSGAKSVCICYFEQENNWWISKVIRKKHDSSVTSVAWHPNNILLATTSMDGKCRIFTTFTKGIDTRTSGANDPKFGEQIAQLDLSVTWTFGVKWSPSGSTLAFAGHNSMICFVDNVENSPSAQNLSLRGLPLRDILFVSEKIAVGVGFDCSPMLFTADETGIWSFSKYLDQSKLSPTTTKGSQISEALGKLYGQPKQGTSSDTFEPTKPRGGTHENCITCIIPFRKAGDHTIRRFSTSGLDGKIVIWDLEQP